MSDELLDKMRDVLRKVDAHAEFLKGIADIYREGSKELEQLRDADLLAGMPNEPDQWSYVTGDLGAQAYIPGDEAWERLVGAGRVATLREWAAINEDERGASTIHPCFQIEASEPIPTEDELLRSLANCEVIIPGGRLVAASFLEALLGLELDHGRNWLRFAYLRKGWDEGHPPEKVAAFLQYVKERPLLFFYGLGWMPPSWMRTRKELPGWLTLPEHLMRMETTLRPMAHKAPDLFTSATADEVEKRERLLVRAMMSDTELQAVAVEWNMTGEELEVHRYLLERFAQSSYLRTKLEIPPGDILDGCGWDGTKDNYRRLKEAIHRLRTVGRLRAYKHKEDREELLGRTGKASPRKGRREKMGAFVNSSPLWDVEPFYVEGGDRVLYYVFRPMGNLFHHVNTHHQGRPAFYRYELEGLVPKLQRELASNTDGVQAALLLSAIKSAKGNADAEGWLVFDYKETAKALQVPTMGKLPTRSPRDPDEEKIKARIQELVELRFGDKEIAEALSAALSKTITRTDAKKLRERLVGGSLAPRLPTDPRKLRPKLEKMLKALQTTHPEFLQEWSFPARGPRWSVRIAPQWSPK
jgi:hypothetical protein